MTSRDRVIAALNHREADRIPIDLGGFNASTILAEAYSKLLNHLRIQAPIRIGDTSQFWVLVDEAVRERFNLDVEPCYPLYDTLGCRRDRDWKDWRHPSGTDVQVSSDFAPVEQADGSFHYQVGRALYRLPSGGHYFDVVENPYSWVQTSADVQKVEIPVMDKAEISYISEKAAQMRRESDRFIITEIFGGWNDIAGPWLGHEKFYIDIIANTSMMHALFEKMTEAWMRKIDQ